MQRRLLACLSSIHRKQYTPQGEITPLMQMRHRHWKWWPGQ